MTKRLLSSLLLLTSCAAGYDRFHPITGASWAGEGVLALSAEEGHLFADPRMVGVFPNHCVTIAARSKRAFNELSRLQGRRVRVEGTALHWPGGTTVSIKVGGRTIRNVCNSGIIVIPSIITSM